MEKLRPWAPFLILAATGVLAFFTVIDRPRTYFFFSTVSYYLILAAVVYWTVSFLGYIRESRANRQIFWQSYGRGLIFSLLLAGLIFFSVKPYFRILSDEANLLAVSKSMTYERRTDNVTMGMTYYHNFYPLNRETEHRPLLFPFLTHLLHTVLGYRASNPFVLNFLVLSALFFLIFSMIKHIRGNIAAYAAVVLVAAQPIVSQNATSGGLDLLATFLMLLGFWALYRYLETSSGPSFQFLWATLILFSLTRYESWALAAVLIAGLALHGKLKPALFSTSLLYPLTPLLGLPYVWQRLIAFSKANQFETPPGVAAFSLNHFLEHSGIFLKSLMRFDFYLPFATLVQIGGVLAILYFLGRSLAGSWPQKKMHRDFLWITSLASLAFWGILAAYHSGDIAHPSTSRYFVYFAVLFSVLLALGLFELRFFRDKPHAAWLVAALAFVLYHPQSVEDRYCNTQILARQYRDVMSLLKKQKDPNILVIAERPGLFTVHDVGSVNFVYANQHKEELLLQLGRHLFKDIFVVQDIRYDTMQPSAETALDPGIWLEPLMEKENTAEDFTRVSRVVYRV
jgi:hypothetical protein